MKTSKTILLLVWVLFNFTCYVSCQNSQPTEKLLGLITKADLQSNNFTNWFTPEFEAYMVDQAKLPELKSTLREYQITVFMGTWCGDSKKEVPRFYKVLEAIDYPMEQLQVIAVNNTREQYKKSPTGEEEGLNILRVPTFIVYKDGKEANRIIESPIANFELDLLNIVTSNSYQPNYFGKKITN